MAKFVISFTRKTMSNKEVLFMEDDSCFFQMRSLKLGFFSDLEGACVDRVPKIKWSSQKVTFIHSYTRCKIEIYMAHKLKVNLEPE
jgi:hypothetical protein